MKWIVFKLFFCFVRIIRQPTYTLLSRKHCVGCSLVNQELSTYSSIETANATPAVANAPVLWKAIESTGADTLLGAAAVVTTGAAVLVPGAIGADTGGAGVIGAIAADIVG
jgi:hypothetical protein